MKDIHTAKTVIPPAPYPGNMPTMRPEAPYMVFGEPEFEERELTLAEQLTAELKRLEQRHE